MEGTVLPAPPETYGLSIIVRLEMQFFGCFIHFIRIWTMFDPFFPLRAPGMPRNFSAVLIEGDREPFGTWMLPCETKGMLIHRPWVPRCFPMFGILQHISD